jgi:hypothetical protein
MISTRTPSARPVQSQPDLALHLGVLELADRREKVVACLLAATTGFAAEPAVLVVGGVPVALLGTGEASHRTGFDHCADEREIWSGLACHDAAGGVAGVGAVEAEPNATHHLAHVVLGKIGVGTTRTTGGTIQALFDTTQKRVAIEACRLWMQPDDLLKGHVLSSRSGEIGHAFRRAFRLRPSLERTAICSSDQVPSQGIVPSRRRARMAAAFPATSSCDQRSNAHLID